LAFLRILREMLFLKQKNISKEFIIKSAAKKAHLDLELFEKDFKSEDILRKFQADLKEKNNWDVELFPTIVFQNPEGEWKKLEENNNYKEWENTLYSLYKGPFIKRKMSDTPLELLDKNKYLASVEIAVLLNEQIDVVEQELEVEFQKGNVIKEAYKHGLFWKKKSSSFNIAKKVNRKSTATIIGGGIAGLSTAINLKKIGFDTTVYEKSAQNRSNGLGFLILKNGIEAMNLMGLHSQLEKLGNHINHFIAYDSNKNVIFKKELSNFIALNRDDCIKMLQDALGAENIQYNKRFLHLAHDESGEAEGVFFTDGTYKKSDLIIGADGIYSGIRKTLFPDSQLEDVGYKEIVCITHSKELSSELTDTFIKVIDDGKSMGIIPFGKDKFIWFLQFDTKKYPLQNDHIDNKIDLVYNATEKWPEPFKSLVRTSDFSKAYLWNMKRMEALPKFHKDGVMLVGDAAHPLISFTSQGTNSAIEDSVVFSHYLSNEDSLIKMKKSFCTFSDSRQDIIKKYIKDGDELLSIFLSSTSSHDFKAPYSNGNIK